MKTELKPCTAHNHNELNATLEGCPACRETAPGLTEALTAGDRAALLLIFKTAWKADRGRDNMELTLAYAEAVRVLGITHEELEAM